MNPQIKMSDEDYTLYSDCKLDPRCTFTDSENEDENRKHEEGIEKIKTRLESLMHLVHDDKTENLRNALSNGAERSQRELDKALICAARHGDREKMEILLEHGASPTAEDSGYMTPLEHILSNKFLEDTDLVTLFAKYCKDQDQIEEMIDPKNGSLLRDAIGEPKALKDLIELGANVNAPEYSRPLVLSAPLKHILSKEVIEDTDLVTYFASIFENQDQIEEARDPKNRSMLRATIDKHKDWIEERAKNVNAPEYRLSHPLVLSVMDRHYESAKILLEAGSDIDNVDECDKCTELIYAVRDGNNECIELLLQYGADINKIDLQGYTPLMHACLNRHDESMDLLLKKGADVNLVSKEGQTVLSMAVGYGDVELVEKMLQNGADVNLTTDKTNNILMEAVTKGNRKVLKYVLSLVDNDAEAQGTTVVSRSFLDALCTKVDSAHYNRTPLTAAISHDYLAGAQLLMNHGADVNLRDGYGCTPLTLALTLGSSHETEMSTQALVRFGADPNKKGGRFGRNTRHRVPDDLNEDSIFEFTMRYRYAPKVNDFASPFEYAIRYGPSWNARLLWAAGSSIEGCRSWGSLDLVPWANTKFILGGKEELYDFLKEKQSQPRSLGELSRFIIRQRLGTNVRRKIDLLPVPGRLKDYLKIPKYEIIEMLPKSVKYAL